MNRTIIGLDSEKSKQITYHLSVLLADLQVGSQSLRSLHWNVKGPQFFEMHAQYEDLLNNLLGKIDEVAERILSLGVTPPHTFNDYSSLSSLSPAKNISAPKDGCIYILDMLNTLMAKEREIVKLAADASDEGTVNMLGDYIQDQEKLYWMYSSFLG